MPHKKNHGDLMVWSGKNNSLNFSFYPTYSAALSGVVMMTQPWSAMSQLQANDFYLS